MNRATRRLLPVIATTLSVAGLVAGSAQAAKLKVTGQQTTITPSAQATHFLAQHSITVSALGPATLASGSLTLPIVSGSVKTPSLTGRIVHNGGVKFTSGKRSVALRNFVLVRAAQTTVLAARTGGKELIVARVTKLTRTTSGSQTVVTGDLKLSAAAASDINRWFGKHVVNVGADIGTLTSTVTVA